MTPDEQIVTELLYMVKREAAKRKKQAMRHGGGEAGDAAADDEDLVVVVCVGVGARVCHPAWAGHSHNILCALYYCQQLTGN